MAVFEVKTSFGTVFLTIGKFKTLYTIYCVLQESTSKNKIEKTFTLIEIQLIFFKSFFLNFK